MRTLLFIRLEGVRIRTEALRLTHNSNWVLDSLESSEIKLYCVKIPVAGKVQDILVEIHANRHVQLRPDGILLLKL